MKNNKFSNVPPLIEENRTIHDPLEKSNLFNNFFASKSTVQNPNDPTVHITIRNPNVRTVCNTKIYINKLGKKQKLYGK